MNLEGMTDEMAREQTGLSLEQLRSLDAHFEAERQGHLLKCLHLGVVYRPEYVDLDELFQRHLGVWLQENFEDFHRESARFGFGRGFHEGFKVGAKEAVDRAEKVAPGLKGKAGIR